jgi:hypothetical protein
LPAKGIVAVQTSNVVQCLGGERRREGTGQRRQHEAAHVHVGTVGRMRAKVNQPLTADMAKYLFPFSYTTPAQGR